MSMKVEFYRKDWYGQEMIYPTGEQAEAVKTLTGRKTLREMDVWALRRLGLEVEEVPDPDRKEI